MIDIYKIDVTGFDILSKRYAIMVLYNKKYAYAYKFSAQLQSKIKELCKQGAYGIKKTRYVKPRIYSTVVYLILKQIYQDHPTNQEDFEIHFCNDFDGHQGYIVDRIRELTVKNNIFLDISVDNYSFRKHPKNSSIQQLGLRLSKGDWTDIHKALITDSEIHNLLVRKRNRKKNW